MLFARSGHRIFLIIRITITGIVQGVGFRPFIYRSAISHNLVGFVRNTDAYVEILIQGNNNALNDLFQISQKKTLFLGKSKA